MNSKRQEKSKMKAEVQAAARKGETVKSENPAKHPTVSPLLVLISAPSGGGTRVVRSVTSP